MDKPTRIVAHAVYGEIRVFENDLISNVVADGVTVWEHELYEALFEFYVPGTDVVDIGANFGLSSLYLRALGCEDATFHMFEPQADVFAMLVGNTRGLPRRKMYNVALGSPGFVGLLAIRRALTDLNVGGTEVSAYPEHHRDDVYVASVALDDVIFERRVSVVNMDVEGAEYEVILGALRFLSTHRPALHVELLTPEAFERVVYLLASVQYKPHLRIGPHNFIFTSV